jgi:integrase
VLLETRSSRLQLPVSKKPIFVKAGTGIGLGYRRTREGAGTWVVRVADGRGANWTKRFAIADDYEGAGLDYWQAQTEAQAIARRAGLVDGDTGEPVTVSEAVDAYEQQLKTRGGDLGNVPGLRLHLPPGLGAKRVSELTAGALRVWRDGLTKQLAPATVNRTSTVLKAALNLAAETDNSVSTKRAWESGLASIADAEKSRNVILIDDEVRSVVAASYRQSDEFGLLVEVAAVTGGRPSQLARTEAQDLQGDRPDPRIIMPTSHKGAAPKYREVDDSPEAMRRRRSTANRVLTILKAALNHAHREGRCASDDAWRTARAFREADAVKLRYLSDDESRRLTNACPADFRALVTGAL